MSKTGFAMFLAGATVGSAATWLCLRRYYEQIAQEEIDSVKAAFAERKPVNTNIAGENDNYTQISLVYYAGDGVLADDEDEVVEDIEDTVGEDFAEHFGEYEDDSVFIRNDRLRCDYEILRDNRSFSDVAEGSNY